jgi:hypothetical protein
MQQKISLMLSYTIGVNRQASLNIAILFAPELSAVKIPTQSRS